MYFFILFVLFRSIALGCSFFFLHDPALISCILCLRVSVCLRDAVGSGSRLLLLFYFIFYFLFYYYFIFLQLVEAGSNLKRGCDKFGSFDSVTLASE